MRVSQYKQEILSLLTRHHLMSITDIHKKITGVDFSTIFRNVEQLEKGGEIKKVIIDKDKILYELGSHVHSHFFCKGCKKIESLAVSFSEKIFSKKTLVEDVVIRGMCEQCNTYMYVQND